MRALSRAVGGHWGGAGTRRVWAGAAGAGRGGARRGEGRASLGNRGARSGVGAGRRARARGLRGHAGGVGARGQGQAARAPWLAGLRAVLGRAGMAPPPPPPQLLLLAALAGLLGPSEVRRPAPEKPSARDLKALCQKFVLEGVARGEETRSSPLGGLGLGGRGQSPRRGQTPQLFCALNPQVVAEPAEEAGARCPEGLWPLPPQVGAWRAVGERSVKGQPSPALASRHPPQPPSEHLCRFLQPSSHQRLHSNVTSRACCPLSTPHPPRVPRGL